jgi:hypothetical protein
MPDIVRTPVLSLGTRNVVVTRVGSAWTRM